MASAETAAAADAAAESTCARTDIAPAFRDLENVF
jgi:hypothetical protein